MKKCIIYGNCQRGLLERYLLKSNFVKYYQIIPTVPVQCKNKQNLDAEILSSVDLIIYQNVSDTFGHEFSSQAILSQLKPSCEKILFPSMYFNAYWPQATKQPVVRRLRDLNTTPGGLFPHGDSNIIRLMQSGTSLEKIINIVSDEDFYSESDVMESINKSFYELNKREKENNVDIAVSDYIYNNLKNRYLMHTINHPTCFVGVYVVRQILDILGIEHEDFESQYMTNEHRLSTLTKYDFELPIYPSVIRWLNLSFVDKNYRYKFYYENRLSFERYVDYYYKHSIGMEIVENKNQDDYIENRNPVKLLDCPAAREYFERNKESLRQNVITLNSVVTAVNNNVRNLAVDVELNNKVNNINNVIKKMDSDISMLFDATSRISESMKKTEKNPRVNNEKIVAYWCDNVILFRGHAFLPTLKDIRRIHSRDFSTVASLLAKDSPSSAIKNVGTVLASHCSKRLALAYILINSGGIWNSKLGFVDKIKEFLIWGLKRKEVKKYV